MLNKLNITYEQFTEDAVFFNEISTDFSSATKQLNSSIQASVRSIHEVYLSSNHCATGSQNIAGKTILVHENTCEMKVQTSEARENANKLVLLTEKFKI